MQYRMGCLVAMVAVLGLVGCGDDIDDFTGTWSWNDGSSASGSCEGESFNESLSGNVSIIEGSTSDLVVSDDDCNWNFDIEGDDANIVAGQSCEHELQTEIGVIGVTEYWSTFVLSVNADSMTVSGSGTLEIESGGSCSTSISGTLTRVGG